MNNLKLTRFSTLISIIYLFIALNIIFNAINEANSLDASSSASDGMILGFLLPHFAIFLLALIFNVIIMLKKTNTKTTIIINIILYCISGILGMLFSFNLIFSVTIQIILLVLAFSNYKKRR